MTDKKALNKRAIKVLEDVIANLTVLLYELKNPERKLND